VTEMKELQITLIGNEQMIQEHLSSTDNISIMHAEEVITGEDEPVRAVRRKKNASLVLMAHEVKEGRADACISAGNTGALMSAGVFVVECISGFARLSLILTLLTVDGKGFVFLDVGANVDAAPSHLVQYPIMGSIYAEKVRAIKNPSIGLLNVGTEDGKGNDLTKKTFNALQEQNLNFIVNVEA